MHLLLLLACQPGPDDSAAPACPAPGPAIPGADLDGDGWPDLAFAQTEDAAGAYLTTSPVFWGGAEGFSAERRSDYPTTGADDVAIADLDGDGWPELIFASVGDGEARAVDSLVYRGAPGGPDPTSEPLRLPTVGAAAVTVADLDADGWPELIFANRYDGGSVSLSSYTVDSYIYWGSAEGPSPQRVTGFTTVGAADIRAADLDGDGWPELAVASGTFFVDESLVYAGSADGWDLDHTQPLPSRAPEGLELADFDGDGLLDLFLADFYDALDLDLDSPLYLGGAEGFSADRRIELPTHGATDARAADLNGDGCLDLTVAHGMEGSMADMDFLVDSSIFWGAPGGPDGTVTGLPTSSAAAVDAADLDGDGDVDLVFANRYDEAGEPAVDSVIYWNDGGFSAERVTLLPTVGAAGVAASGDW
ncbi:MAG: VCBS repeat-containing protein [Pseudomonadota bacterium]